jgi:arsenate reductase (glutaredoxin)
MLKVYTYANCDTCRKAVKFLKEHKVAFQELPIRDTAPSKAELRAMLESVDGDLRKLFNTSGRDYKEMDLKTTLPTLTEDEALELLTKNGNLVKRPFAIGAKTRLVGFAPDKWNSTALS